MAFHFAPGVRAHLLACLLAVALPCAKAHASPAAPPSPAPELAPTERLLTVRRGDTLAELLAGAGVDRAEAHAAIEALRTTFSPRDLRPGQEIGVRLDPARDHALTALEIEAEPGRTIIVRRQGRSWSAEEHVAARQRHLARIEAEIEVGVMPTLTSAGLPAPLAFSLIRALSHQVDFQRDIQPGDRIEVMFERLRAPDGDLIGHGRVLHVALTLSGEVLSLWRHDDEDGEAEWYDDKGLPLRQAFLRTPLDGARISSGFGMRRHPILGFSRMHKGVDFAAPTGTPVYAAANGTVASIRFERGYGRIVRLRHQNGLETRYAHLSRVARGLRAGAKVKQGDVIGSVGSTGLATGPHLHYEVVQAGRQINPATKKLAARPPLRGRQLAAFQESRRQLQRHLAELAKGQTEVAMAAE
jgi:murein DD-endopeptidase MepM/ murein hydrolase activator NlpD